MAEGMAKDIAAIGQVVNIGSTFEISIGDAAAMIADIMNVKLDIQSDETRTRPEMSAVERLLANNEKAKALLG